MPKEKRHTSEALASVHETMQDFYSIGAIDEATMRSFDRDVELERLYHALMDAEPETLEAERARTALMNFLRGEEPERPDGGGYDDPANDERLDAAYDADRKG